MRAGSNHTWNVEPVLTGRRMWIFLNSTAVRVHVVQDDEFSQAGLVNVTAPQACGPPRLERRVRAYRTR
jgi:hypothetical protein